MNRILLLLVAALSTAVAAPKEVILTYRDGAPAAEVEIQLQYHSGWSVFRVYTDQQGKATFDRNNFAQLHVIQSRGDERVHFHLDADRIQWPFVATLPGSSKPNAPKAPFAVVNGQNEPVGFDQVNYWEQDSPAPKPFVRKAPLIFIPEALSLAPARYDGLWLYANGIFINISRAALENGGTLKLGIISPPSP